MLGDEVSLTDEVVLLELGGPEVDLDGAQNISQTLAALRAGGVIHQTGSHEVVQHRVVACPLPSKQLSTTSRALRGGDPIIGSAPEL